MSHKIVLKESEIEEVKKAGIDIYVTWTAVIGQWPHSSRLTGTAILRNGELIERDTTWNKYIGGAGVLFGRPSGVFIYEIERSDAPAEILARQVAWEEASEKREAVRLRYSKAYQAYREEEFAVLASYGQDDKSVVIEATEKQEIAWEVLSKLQVELDRAEEVCRKLA